jgi:YhhN family
MSGKRGNRICKSMTSRKKLYISTILFVILALSIWFIILDFSRFYSQNYSYAIYPSALLKRINVILAAFIVWAIGKDGLCLTDSRRMKAAFIFVILGEAAFALGDRAIGVGMFAVCQILLIIRNSTGLKYKLKHASNAQKKELTISVVIVMLILLVFAFLFALFIKDFKTAIALYIYGIILSISLWAGLANSILVLLPKVNSIMVAAGMICFFCCDVLVGFDAAMEAGVPWLLVNSFIWVFYIPALVLLALSCYRYNKIQ